MSVFGTIPQDTWLEHFNDIGLTPTQAQAIQHDCLLACILAGHALHNTYSSSLESLRAIGIDISTAGHHTNSKGIG
eukprot:2795481-Rhodomonas_salina.1